MLVIKSGCKWKYLVEKLVKKVFKITFVTEQRDEMQIKQKAEKQKLKKFRDKVSLDYEFYVKAY